LVVHKNIVKIRQLVITIVKCVFAVIPSLLGVVKPFTHTDLSHFCPNIPSDIQLACFGSEYQLGTETMSKPECN